MPELRWTLLLVGALFVAVLAWTERRKTRQLGRSVHEPLIQDPPPQRPQREPTLREPALVLPEMRARDPAPPQDLPVVQVDALPPILRPSSSASPWRSLGSDDAPSRIEPGIDEPSAEHEAAGQDLPREPVVSDVPVLEAAALEEELQQRGHTQQDEAQAGMDADEVANAPESGAALPPELAESPQTREPIVEWPPEDDRRIIALRLVSSSPERFSGRAVRTALVAEGFVHGKFSIFHKADAQQRAMLSAASLSKPGAFDLETIDTQRFSGLNLFAVVSGSQPAREVFERLLACARNLNERLEGGLQDDRGGPLTPSRIAALRESMGAAAAPLS